MSRSSRAVSAALSFAAVLAFALPAAAAPAPARKPIHLVIFHTNDVHGWIMARKSQRPADDGRMVGGAAAFKSLVERYKGPKLVLDAGDWFQGTPEGNVTKGDASVDVFNAVGYDAVEIGNHDFDFGEANLRRLIRGLKMPVLGANIYEEKTGKRAPFVKPWIVKNVDGVKVGIFGLLTTNMRNLTFPENYAGLRFRREIDEAREQVRALKKQGATVIIALTHIGHEEPTMSKFEGDETLAAEVPGIDVIVGGHSHSFLRDPQHDPKNGTLIVQAGSYLWVAGRVDLEIDPKTKRVLSSRGRLISLDPDKVGEDPAVAAVVKRRSDEVSKVYDVVIATAQAALTRSRDGESSLGDWMTDCERGWAHADLAIQNAGGIRSDMAQGPVTMREIFNIMPFDNRVVELNMDGKLVERLLDHGVDRTKGMVQVSGAAFIYDRDAAPGKRLENAMVDGRRLDPSATYKVATIDFLVKGGDGYTPFSRAEKTVETRTLLRDVLRECAVKQGLIRPPSGGRMTPESSPAMAGAH